MLQAAQQESGGITTWPAWAGYAVAVAVEAVLTVSISIVEERVPGVNIRTPYVLAVGAVAYYFGVGPAIAAFVLGFIGWAVFLLPPHHLAWPPSLGPSWAMAWSLLLTTGIAGVAMLWFRESTIRTRELASQLADSLNREQHFSLLLQKALLPREPSIGEDYEVAVGYVPLFSSREIGGDFYDIYSRKDGVAVVLVGDVSGKGLEAAALAAATRSTVHAFVHEDASPADALTRTNSVLYSLPMPPDNFVTAFLAVLDRASGRFVYSSAGHPPAVVVRADGRVDALEISRQAPLGIMEHQAFTKYYSHLEPGDKLVVYTDGISEARRHSELFDTEGVSRTLVYGQSVAPGEAVSRLISAATEWSDGGLTDDAAVAVVQRHPL